MTIVLALDKFKGTLTAVEACEAVRHGFEAAWPGRRVDWKLCPIADGGDGTVEVLAAGSGGGEMIEIEVENAVASRVVPAQFYFEDGTATMEMASASGLALLGEEERDPLRATTLGTGQLMRAAWDRGARKIVMGLGGSATNDGGTGIARAFGYRFLDAQGNEIVRPGDLVRLEEIEMPANGMPEVDVCILADVTNPLLGPNGATAVYGPQKGVTTETHELLEAGLERLAEVTARAGLKDCRSEAGAGAAGGCAFGLMCFFGARVEPGFDYISRRMGLPDAIAGANLVITGEGKIDSQTLSGKGPHGVACLAQKQNVAVAGVAGVIADNERAKLEQNFTWLASLTETVGKDRAFQAAEAALVETSRALAERIRRDLGA